MAAPMNGDQRRVRAPVVQRRPDPAASAGGGSGSSATTAASLPDGYWQYYRERMPGLAQRKAADGGPPPASLAAAEQGFADPASSLPAADRIGRHLGADLSGVRAHTGPAATAACDALGAEAYTVGNRIVFRDPAPSVALQAHETAHVVQQGGVTPGPSSSAAGATALQPFRRGATEDQLELEADRFAERVAGPGSLPARAPATASPSVPGAPVQRFAPAGHRTATAEGLAGSFGAEEIGEIYAANWERDFSQGAPQLADMVLAWKECKLIAATKGADSEDFARAAARFRETTERALTMTTSQALSESLGGYRPWEHMDNPGSKDANKRWKIKEEKAGQLPGYILDSKAYIKDQMVAAVEAYRTQRKLGSVGTFDNWAGGAKPEGYGQAKGDAADPSTSRASVAKEATAQAEQAHARQSPQGANQARALEGGGGDFAASAQSLGRGMHAAEDFFAHSNWLELAKDLKKKLAGDPAAKVEGKLITGTFELNDKAHALGHKLIAVATALEKDFDLLLKVFGRKEASTVLDEKGNEKLKKQALSSLSTQSWTLTGDIIDVGNAASDATGAIKKGKGKVLLGDIVTNRGWLAALRQKGERLIERGDAAASETGHGKLAKDQPEESHPGHDEKDYAGALKLATEANRLLFAPLKNVMAGKDAEAARAALTVQLALVDRIIAPPTPEHPLFGLVEVK